MTQNSKSNTKLTYDFFLEIAFALFTQKFRLSTKMPLIFFRKWLITLSTSSSSSIYKIAIAINTPTTMNNQFEILNAHKINLHLFFLITYELKTIYLSLSLYIHKKTKILILKFLWFIEPLKLTILGGSLSYELLCAWRIILCAKKVLTC